MNIVQYRHDQALAGSLSHMRTPETQQRWDVFLKAVDGLTMTDAELAIFREHTHRSMPREGGYPESVLIVGRQGGKDVTAGDVVAHRIVQSLLSKDTSVDGAHAILVAQDMRAALRTCFRYASLPFDRIPMLRSHVVGRTADTLSFDNGLTLSAFACRPAASRGLRAIVAVLNELAFFRTSDGNPVDTEMLRSIRPCLATTGGKLIVLSSPYAQTGAPWDLHRQHFGREDSPTLIWQASAPQMNPMLPADDIERMRADDPEAFASEVLGEFRAGISSLFDPLALESAVGNWREQPPRPGIHYQAHFDPSGGRNAAAALGIAHAEAECVIVDLVRAWPSPHNVETVAGEAAALAKSYGLATCTVDRYAPGHVAQSLARHGVRVRPDRARHQRALPRAAPARDERNRADPE